MKSTKWDELSINETAIIFSKNMAQLWKVHPFREGNTRTIITFCCHYAEKKGFPLDTDLLKDNSDYVRNALVAASAVFHDLGDRSNIEYLIRIIKDAIERGENL
jgi:cell filamentation protein